MLIIWLPEAEADLDVIDEYHSLISVSVAESTINDITLTVGRLRNNPGMGRPGRVMSTKELIVSKHPYIIVYRVSNNAVEILRVFHQSRCWPENF